MPIKNYNQPTRKERPDIGQFGNGCEADKRGRRTGHQSGAQGIFTSFRCILEGLGNRVAVQDHGHA